MSYDILKEYFHLYRIGKISKYEMMFYIHMWQRAENYSVVGIQRVTV